MKRRVVRLTIASSDFFLLVAFGQDKQQGILQKLWKNIVYILIIKLLRQLCANVPFDSIRLSRI